jgi:hypothetical protein
MKIKKGCLILAIVTGILCASAIGQTELLQQEEKPFLIVRPYPTLAGIDKLNIAVLPLDTDFNKNESVWAKLKAKVINKCKEAGLEIIPGIAGNILNVPELRIYINVLKLEDSQQYTFHTQTSLSRAVCLIEQTSTVFKTDVWKTIPVMQMTSTEQMPDKITNTVLEQVEAFIQSHKEANQPVRQSPNISTNITDSLTAAEKQTIPGTKSSVAEYKYVASKNSTVFHKPQCRSAKRIKPENLVGYNNREEAIKSGKRPCKTCNP